MINNNKILTVSYGTFSCTLEGFDDSFGTMKAIAEYFRDLSADDRYFGAEPAQPDAQMLARIAEREISRHVEAREDDGRIVLSARNAPKAAAALAAPVKDDADEVEDESTNEVSEPTEVTPKAFKAPPVKVKITSSAETPLAAEAAKVATPEVEEAFEEDEILVEAGEEVDEGATADTAERDIVPSLPDEDVEAFFAESKPSGRSDHITIEDEDTPSEQDRVKADSIADKLKRIRAVVSQQGDAAKAPEYSEDQHADATVTPSAKIVENIADANTYEDEDRFEDEDEVSNDVLTNTLRDLEDALDADDAAEDVDEDFDDSEECDDENDDIAAILNRLENETDIPDATSDLEKDDYLYALDEDDDDMGDNILAAMDSLEATVADDLSDENLFEDEDTSGEPQPEVVEVEAPVPVPPGPAPVAPRTRVLKVKRATLEAAIQSGQLEEYDEEEDETPSPSLRKAPLTARSSLSDEAEEALSRELAELEADIEADDAVENLNDDYDDDYEDDLNDFDDEEEVDAPDVTPRARITGSADEDLSRLLEESKQQMEEPEAATRRDAFAHLRAAVAAKKADEAVGGGADDEETDEAYRDDLANVVRPRRPVSGERIRTERPPEARPAPLKLVAEQRIDTGETRTVTPVRPRRVAAVPQQPVQEGAPHAEDFTNFADEMGATKLPDLLEAAAAYLSFVEGHEQFSRPQLMTKVRQVEKENFTREDSLRSFGKLLREGKIEKLKGGRFQASDQIGFRPAKRAAG